MMNKKSLCICRNHGRVTANHMFATNLNPLFRGVNWRWEEFPTSAKKWAEVSVWKDFSSPNFKKWKSEIERETGESAKYAAEEIQRLSGVLEWWPNPGAALYGQPALPGRSATVQAGLADSASQDKISRYHRVYYEKIQPIARLHGYFCTYRLFFRMLNPIRRGPNWRWEDFAVEAVEEVVTTVWQHFTDRTWNRWQPEIEQEAKREAAYTADSILENSGLLQWWPNRCSEGDQS